MCTIIDDMFYHVILLFIEYISIHVCYFGLCIEKQNQQCDISYVRTRELVVSTQNLFTTGCYTKGHITKHASYYWPAY